MDNNVERMMNDTHDEHLAEAGWAASLKLSPEYNEKVVAFLEECKAVAADLGDEDEIDYQIASLRHSKGAIFLFDTRPASLTRVYSQCGYYGLSINSEAGVELVPLETYVYDREANGDAEPSEFLYLMNTYGAVKTDEKGKQVSHTIPTLVTKDEGDNWMKYVKSQVESGEVSLMNEGFSTVLDFNPLAELPDDEVKEKGFEVFKAAILRGWKAICGYVWSVHHQMTELAEKGEETLPEDYEAPDEKFWCESGLDEWFEVVKENRLAEGFANQVKWDKRRA